MKISFNPYDPDEVQLVHTLIQEVHGATEPAGLTAEDVAGIVRPMIARHIADDHPDVAGPDHAQVIGLISAHLAAHGNARHPADAAGPAPDCDSFSDEQIEEQLQSCQRLLSSAVTNEKDAETRHWADESHRLSDELNRRQAARGED